MTAKRLTPYQAAQLASDIANGMTKVEAAAKYGISRTTVFRTLKRGELKPGPPKQPKKLKPCGTNAAYQRHRKKGERCWKCSEAHAKEIKRWKNREQRKAWRERQKKSRAARTVEKKSA